MELANTASLTIARLAPLLRTRQLSPVELTRFVIERISRLQPMLNAFISVTADLALNRAKRAEKEILRGEYRGPLHGIPVSLKDLFYTEGIRTTAGSKILRRFVPGENASVVERLLEAGAVLTGKTNLHEFAFGATNVNPHYGSVLNPWDLSRISGGSSGGSAVSVVAALSLASLGTDTGGSIRIPSAACGCVGLKPTYGLVAQDGVIPLATSLDHVGPLCRCVEDAAIMLEVLTGAGSRSRRSPNPSARHLSSGVNGMRIGVPKQYFFERLQLDVRRGVLAAISCLEQLGAYVSPVDLKGMGETAELAAEITAGEALAYHWNWLQKRPSDYGSDLRGRFEGGRNQLSVVYLLAQARRQAYRDRLVKAMKSVDIMALPTLPIVAPRIEEDDVLIGRGRENVRLALLRLTRPGNLSGLPAISVPCGFSAEGLPVGLQLMGHHGDEATILRAAYAYEQATSWHKHFPPDTDVAPHHRVPHAPNGAPLRMKTRGSKFQVRGSRLTSLRNLEPRT
jgi:aspartyl-tRNA(Asn)/glutamyl-tRNA(Gln) amidotransferase subunit A